MNTSSLIKGLLFPLLALLIYAPWSAQIDLWTSHQFYHNGHFDSSIYLDWIYNYGIWPAWTLAVLGLIGLLSGKREFRRVSLFLLLTLAIGSGLIVHGAFKENWGRPRPKQVTEFGGDQPFRPFYSPNTNGASGPAKSFSCGHCTMGFYFFTLVFLGIYYRNRILFWGGIILSVGLGGLLSYARVAQGGHFLSDVIVSAVIMWITALVLFHLLLGKRDSV